MKKGRGISRKLQKTRSWSARMGHIWSLETYHFPFRSSRPIKGFLGIGSRARNSLQDRNMHYADADIQRINRSVMAPMRRLDSMDERQRRGHPTQDRQRNLMDRRWF